MYPMTFDILCLKLSEHHSLRKCPGYRGGSKIESVCLPDGRPVRKNALYLLSAAEYLEKQYTYRDSAVLLYWTDKSKADSFASEFSRRGNDTDTFPEGCAALVQDSVTCAGLLNDLMDLLREFHLWTDLLEESRIAERSPGDLIRDAAGYTEAVLSLVGKTNILYMSEPMDSDRMRHFYGTSYEEVVSTLVTQSWFADSFCTHGVQCYPGLADGLLYYCNIFLNGSYQARITGTFSEGPFADGVVRLFGYLCEPVTSLYIRHYNRSANLKKGMASFFQAAFSGDAAMDSRSTEDALSRYGWHSSDRIVVLKLVQENVPATPDSADYFCANLESQFPECCTVSLEKELFVVRNLTVKSGKNAGEEGKRERETQTSQSLTVFFRESLVRVGVSNEEKGFAHLKMLAEEARDAYYYGNRKNPSFWLYRFGDYVPDYIRDQAMKKYPVEELEPDFFSALREHDRKNSSELLHTLKVYTACSFRETQSAEKLCIHRSTFLHRLERIKAITGTDPSLPAVRRQLELAIFLNPEED